MKLIATYTFFLSISLISGVFALHSTINPTNSILGEWEEMRWEYDKVNVSDKESVKYKEITEDIKKLIGENLIIHQAEKWIFLPNGQLLLKGKKQEKKAQWRIKGRGHILQIKHEDHTTESYNINELLKDQLILNFEVDIEMRGIAKLTFTRRDNK